MRIAFLCKRKYMGKDVIADRYARLYEIPSQLARLGHDVRGFCLSYQGHEEGQWEHDAATGRLAWESRSLGRLYIAGLIGYPRHLLKRLRNYAPDLLIGASDIPHVALARWLATRLGVPYAVDLYDNFEGFGQARIPGMVPALRRAVRGAALVTTTSELLKELVTDSYGALGEVMAMPSTIDKNMFRPLDRAAGRRALGLPENGYLVGTAGGLLRNRGIGDLYVAWQLVAQEHPDAHLVLAGPIDNRLPPPSGPRVNYLGKWPHSRTAELFGALDVGVIYLRDTPFGRYCFPQKAYEMLACGLPLAATRIGVMPKLLESAPKGLYCAGDAADLARAIGAQLNSPEFAVVAIDDWAHIVGVMEQRLHTIHENHQQHSTSVAHG
jgi:glycosyltransferase involved in cell wall biosynthesis